MDGRWWRWSAAAGTARMPAAMALLALVFLGEQATGSYAVGAAQLGATRSARRCSRPGTGGSFDRLPAQRRRSALRRGLSASALVLAALAAAGYVHAPVPVLLVLTAAAAALPAGVPGGYRALLTELLDATVLPRAFSWDAAAVEVEWLLAPLLVSAALLTGQPAAAVLVMACWALLGAWITGLLDVALALMSLLLLPVAFGSTAGHLVIALGAAGLFIAPVNALRAQALQDALPTQLRGEGFSIQYGANGLGTAAGAAITAGLANTSPQLALTINLTIPLLAVTATALTTRYRRRAGRPV